MIANRLFYRMVAAFWAGLGGIILVLALMGLLLVGVVVRLFAEQFPPMSGVIENMLASKTWSWNNILLIMSAGFFIYYGMALMVMKPWARSVGIVLHWIVGAGLLTAAVSVFYALNQSVLANLALPVQIQIILPIAMGLLAAGCLWLGYRFSTHQAHEDFVGRPRQLISPKATCPTCQEPMNVASETCPTCDTEALQAIYRARLVSTESKQEYQLFLNQVTRIGRENLNYEISLDDASVSHDHALIEHHSGRFYLHARKDVNGTFVNETRIRDIEICEGDIIKFGRSQFQFLIN